MPNRQGQYGSKQSSSRTQPRAQSRKQGKAKVRTDRDGNAKTSLNGPRGNAKPRSTQPSEGLISRVLDGLHGLYYKNPERREVFTNLVANPSYEAIELVAEHDWETIVKGLGVSTEGHQPQLLIRMALTEQRRQEKAAAQFSEVNAAIQRRHDQKPQTFRRAASVRTA